MTEVELQDLAVNLDQVTELRDSSVFSIKYSHNVFRPLELDLIRGIQLQLNRDLTVIQRTGYTVLDLLSDVGGLQGVLASGVSLLLSVLNND